MANMILAYKQRALRVGANSYTAGFPPSNTLDTRLDRVWVSVSTGSEYLDATTSDQVFGERTQALSISANLRTIDIHPAGNWVVCAVSTQLEIRTFNQTTGEIGEDTVATLAQPSSQPWIAAKFSPDGNFILATCEVSGGNATVRLRNFDSTTGSIGGAISVTGVGSSAPSTGLRGLAWAPTTTGFAVAYGTSLEVWAFNPSTGAVTEPSSNAKTPGGNVLAVDWHPTMTASGNGYVVAGHVNSPYVTAYLVANDATSTPSTVRAATTPGANPGSDVVALKFSPTGNRLFCSVDTPKAYMYPFTLTSTGFGTPWSDPSVGVSTQRNDVLWSPDGDYVVMGGGGVDAPEVYQVGTSSFTSKVTSFWDSPAVYQNSQALSPNGEWYVSITSAGIAHVTEFQSEMGSAQPVDVVALINTNLTRTAQIRIRAGDRRDMTTSVLYDTSTIDAFSSTISSEIFTLVESEFGVNLYYVLPSTVTADFWRIDITDTAQTDPAFRCSYILLSKALDRTKQISIGASPGLDEAESAVQRTDGDADVVRVRAGRRTMNAVIEYVPTSTAFDEYWPLVVKGIPQYVLFLPDSADQKLNFLAGFLGRPTRPLTLPWVTGLHNNLPFELVEAR